MVLVWNVCACECVFVCVCVCLCEDVWQPSAGGELGAEGSSDLISATGCTPEKSPKVTAIITPHTHTHTTHTPHTHTHHTHTHRRTHTQHNNHTHTHHTHTHRGEHTDRQTDRLTTLR